MTCGWAHLCDLAPGQHSSEETSHCWRHFVRFDRPGNRTTDLPQFNLLNSSSYGVTKNHAAKFLILFKLLHGPTTWVLATAERALFSKLLHVIAESFSGSSQTSGNVSFFRSQHLQNVVRLLRSYPCQFWSSTVNESECMRSILLILLVQFI